MLVPEPGIPAAHSNFRKWLHRLMPALGLILFVLAIWAINHQLRKHSWNEILAAFESLPALGVTLAIAFTVLGYITLTGYDYLAMLYVRHRLPYRRVGFAAFIGYAFSNCIGHSFLTGGTVRYRLYSVWGVKGLDIARVIAFGHIAFYLGMLLLIGQGCLLEPSHVSDEVHVPRWLVQVIGVLMLAAVVMYFIWTNVRREPVRISVLHFHMPSFGLSLAQLVIATFDMLLMAGVLWVLLPGSTGMTFWGFVGLFMIAQVLGVGSQVPGGLGVFEVIMIHVLTPAVDETQVLAALIAYRMIYFIIPLIVAAVMLGVYEIRTHQLLLLTARRKATTDEQG